MDEVPENGALRYLAVSQIEPYEHNPRRGQNPEYERIKASIRSDGMDQALVVTRRPGASHYVVSAGGNTRLAIVKALYAELADPRFAQVPCQVRAWTNEADVLLAHLKENDLRGSLTFLDKALGLAELKRVVHSDGGDTLTQAALADYLKRRGYALSQGLISQMTYAVERLRPWLPVALESGMGRPQVARIRAVDRAAATLWREYEIDTEAEYDQVFAALCGRYDTPDWDIAPLRRALEAEIADRGEFSIEAVSMAFDARLSGRAVAAPSRCDDWEDDEPVDQESHRDSDQGRGERRELPTPTSMPDTALVPGEPGIGEDAGGATTGDRAADLAPRVASESEPAVGGDTTSLLTGDLPALSDVKSLRARLWTLASRLAQRNGLGDLVQPLPGLGLGFVLSDVPDPALVEQLDEATLAQVSMVWWHLAACAELTVAPLEALVPLLPEGSVLQRALVEQDAGLLFASVWTLDPGHTGYRLWRGLDERDWHDLLGLMAAYRALHRVAASEGHALWRVP